MDELLKFLAGIWRFLLREPVVLVVVVAWIGGAIAKLVKWFSEQAAARQRQEREPARGLRREDTGGEAIAREIRRQMEETDRNTERLEREARRRAEKMAKPGPRGTAARAPAQRPAPETADEREERESQREAMVEAVRTKQLDARKSIQIGADGGTATAAKARVVRAAFQVGDLRHAILASEILQPPLSLRDS